MDSQKGKGKSMDIGKVVHKTWLKYKQTDHYSIGFGLLFGPRRPSCVPAGCSPQCEGLEKMDTYLNHRAVTRQRLQEHRLIINKPSSPPGPDQSLHLQNPGGFSKHPT
ncbi:hypothetical protein ROHU_029789 [Labeo rohita]|uniref:Uncharacterized protein n=1 Tax=Labeo rohita TaxID=84645 RepID=A0A498LUU7_LABRO|nr:hypothetical protein ROHU_029789 [Labeo rohita]